MQKIKNKTFNPKIFPNLPLLPGRWNETLKEKRNDKERLHFLTKKVNTMAAIIHYQQHNQVSVSRAPVRW